MMVYDKSIQICCYFVNFITHYICPDPLPLSCRWRPVCRVQYFAFVPALLGAEVPGVKAGAPAMPGGQVRESLDGLPALCAEEAKALIRDFFGASKQAVCNLLFGHERVSLHLSSDAPCGCPVRAAFNSSGINR